MVHASNGKPTQITTIKACSPNSEGVGQATTLLMEIGIIFSLAIPMPKLADEYFPKAQKNPVASGFQARTLSVLKQACRGDLR